MHIGNPNIIDVLLRKYTINYTWIVSFTSKYRRDYILWGEHFHVIGDIVQWNKYLSVKY